MSAPTILRRHPDARLEYALAPDVALVLVDDGSARVLDMGGEFYALPPVSTLFLRETLERGADAAAARVSAEYGVEPKRAAADRDAFLQTLVERGILWRNDERKNRPTSCAARLAAGTLRQMVRCIPTLTAKAAMLLTGARLALVTMGWTTTVGAWRNAFASAPGAMSPQRAETLARSIDEAVCGAAAWNPLGVACKERGLAAWALGRMLGLPATLVIGIELYPLTGHCWCELGERIVSDHPESCKAYVPALCYV